MDHQDYYKKLPEDIRPNVCVHRGFYNSSDEESSKIALKRALISGYITSPCQFLEFDIVYEGNGEFRIYNHSIGTVHDDTLMHILDMFIHHAKKYTKPAGPGLKSVRATFPKIDLYLRPGHEAKHEEVIDSLLDTIQKIDDLILPLYMININNKLMDTQSRNQTQMLYEEYLVKAVQASLLCGSVGLNIDFMRYSSMSRKESVDHVKGLGKGVISISPEFYTPQEHIDFIAQLAKQEGIRIINFWLDENYQREKDKPNHFLSWLEGSYLKENHDSSEGITPFVTVTEMRKRMDHIKGKGIECCFDIHPKYIVNK